MEQPAQQPQSGQALLIILLVLAVALTVVLSVISRSVTDIAITTKEEEASRAFSAAEAGVEEALIGGALSGTFGTVPGEASFQVSVSDLAAGGTSFPSPQKVGAGDAIPLWFVSHADDGSLTCADGMCFTGSSMKVCWAEPGTSSSDSTTPALEVVVLYTATPGNYSTTQIARAAFDPNVTRRSTNQFSAPDAGGCTVSDNDYTFGKNINFADLGIPSSVYNSAGGLQTARLRLLYNTDKFQPVGVNVGNPLPAQGTRIESIGTAGQSTRKIEVFQLYSDLPPIFDFALFTIGGLTK